MSDTQWTGQVRTEDSDGIRSIIIDHPGGNLLNPGVMAALEGHLLDADADPSVQGILLTGAGETFCGGLDVPAIQAGADPVQFAKALVSLLKVFPTLHKPVVAAVNGDAVASGASLVAACDYAAAAEASRVGTYEVSVGIWPMIAQVPLIARIGARAAMENIGSGEPFTAARAREVGLVQAVTSADDLVENATTWLRQAFRASAAAAAGRPSVYDLAQMSYDDALDDSLSRFVAQF